MTTLTLSRAQIQRFLGTAHIIPVSKGIRGQWMTDNAPGWSDGALFAALRDAGALVKSDHFSGWSVKPGLTTITVGEDLPVSMVVKGTVPAHEKD